VITIIHEAEHEYHGKARHYLSRHQLADFRKCPELLHRKWCGLIPDSQSSASLMRQNYLVCACLQLVVTVE